MTPGWKARRDAARMRSKREEAMAAIRQERAKLLVGEHASAPVAVEVAPVVEPTPDPVVEVTEPAPVPPQDAKPLTSKKASKE